MSWKEKCQLNFTAKLNALWSRAERPDLHFPTYEPAELRKATTNEPNEFVKNTTNEPTLTKKRRTPPASLLRLAGHGDEPNSGEDFPGVSCRRPRDPDQLLVLAADGCHKTAALLELLEQRARDIRGGCGRQDDRVVGSTVGPSLVAVANPDLDVPVAEFT